MADGELPPRREAARRHDRKGRSTCQARKGVPKTRPSDCGVEHWVWLPVELLMSPAYRALTLAARRILDLVMIEHNGQAGMANGELTLPHTVIEASGVRANSIAPAIRELEGAGLISVRRRGRIAGSPKNKSSLFRLTWLGCWDANGELAPPSHGWKGRTADDVARAKAGRQKPRATTRINDSSQPAKTIVHKAERTENMGFDNPRKRRSYLDSTGVVVGDAAAIPPSFTRPRSPAKAETRNQFTCPDCGALPGEPCTFPDDAQGRSQTKRGINHQSRYLLAVEAGKQQLARKAEDLAELGRVFRGKIKRGEVIEVGKRFIPRDQKLWAVQ